MTTPENLDSVMRRIQKLLAIANDDRADPNEAAAAASMAEKVMRKYQLEHADVIMASLLKGDDLATAEVVATAKTNGTKVKQVPLWANWLAVKVAEFNDVGARLGTTKGGEACVRFYGFSSDVQVAEWIFNYLVSTVNRLVDGYKDSADYRLNGRKVLNAYRQGVTTGILTKLLASIAEKKAEAESTAATTGRDLVVVKQNAIEKRFGDFGYSKKSKTSVQRGNAFSHGVRDGQKVDVTRRAVTGSSSSTLLLG